MIAEELGTDAAPASRALPWRGALVASVALVWCYGLGSVLAVVLHACWRRRTTTRLDARLLRVGLIVGIAGLVATVASVVVLIEAESS